MKKRSSHSHLQSNKENPKKGLTVLRWITGSVFILAVIGLIVYFLYQWKLEREYDALQSVSTPVATATPTPPPQPISLTPDPATPTPEPTPVPVDIPIDFEYLQDINSDIVGWVYVEGTDIDYPILYDEDEYYLNHNYRGDYSYAGSIFMQQYNSDDFSDFNTVLYGHNMGSGTMFAQLHRFEKESFFDEYDTIIVYRPSYKLTYRIFAAYRTNNRNIMTNYIFDAPEDREAYLEHVFNHTYSNYDYDVPVTEADRIITLSTCIGNPEYRYLVQGVLISEEYGIYDED